MCSRAGSEKPLRASGARSAKKRKFSAPRLRRRGHEADRLAGVHRLDERDLLGARLDRVGDRVQHVAALLARRVAPCGNALSAARAAASMSAASPAATFASTLSSIGVRVVEGSRRRRSAAAPSMKCARGRRGSARGAARAARDSSRSALAHALHGRALAPRDVLVQVVLLEVHDPDRSPACSSEIASGLRRDRRRRGARTASRTAARPRAAARRAVGRDGCSAVTCTKPLSGCLSAIR